MMRSMILSVKGKTFGTISAMRKPCAFDDANHRKLNLFILMASGPVSIVELPIMPSLTKDDFDGSMSLSREKNRFKLSIEVGTSMSQNLRYMFLLPLCPRDFGSTADLLHQWLHRTRTDGNAFGLIVVIVDNPTLGWRRYWQKHCAWWMLRPQNNSRVSSTFPFHDKVWACLSRLIEPLTLWRFSMKWNLHSAGWWIPVILFHEGLYALVQNLNRLPLECWDTGGWWTYIAFLVWLRESLWSIFQAM